MNQEHSHEHTVTGELICHLPYAVFSVAFALIILSVMSAFTLAASHENLVLQGAELLFHSFHFMHIVFAATGTIIAFCRFSKNIWMALLIGTISPTFFCMLSDAILPYLGGRLLGVTMHFHICFLSDTAKVIPFLFVGILNGFLMSRHHDSKLGLYAISSHAVHILVSSLASTFYLVSHGFTDWYVHIGIVFLFLIIAVVVPCTLSDVVVPLAVAKRLRKKK
jgi:hypothetical protein